MRRTRKKGSRTWAALLLLSGIAFLISASVLASNYSADFAAESEFKALSKRVQTAEQDVTLMNGDGVTPYKEAVISGSADTYDAGLSDESAHEILNKYAGLYQDNPDMGGWIRIDGTVIDYPVMYTPDEPEKYLHLSFEGESSNRGVPFIGAGCAIEPRSQNIVVYGHHMKNGSMFAGIVNYKDMDFWRKHPTIYFSTLYEEGEYEVFAAFETDTYAANDLRCYDFINAKDEADFYDYIRKIQKAALFDTGVTVSYDDELLTLSTCAYHTSNGRFLVVARKQSINAKG